MDNVNCGCDHPGNVENKVVDSFSGIYEKLIEPLPEEAIEKTDKAKTRRGYDTTGFQYQYLVDRLNEAIGIDGWAVDWKIIKEIPGTWGVDKKPVWELVVEVTIVFYKKGISDISDPYGVYRKCVGCHKAEMYGDALKGAITNGFKKTVAFFGLGAQAYRGTIDDDYMPIPNDVKASTVAADDEYVGHVKNVTFTTLDNHNEGGMQGSTIYKIEMDNGETYRTISREYAEVAKKAKEDRKAIKISFTTGNAGCHIVSLCVSRWS